MPEPLNILLIHADQHRHDCLGISGHPLLRTPHLDRLAAEGVRFTQAVTPAPICSPARASLLTGVFPTRHGCLTIPWCCETFTSADPGLPTWTRLLADAGYDVRWVGKFHQEVAGSPADHGVREFVSLREYRAYRQARGLPPPPQGWFGAIDRGVTVEHSSLAWQARQVVRMLHEQAAGGRPFVLRWDPPEPHLPNHVPEDEAGLYPPETIPPWPSFPDPLHHKPPAQRRSRLRWGTEGMTWAQWQPVVSRYLATIDLLDRQVGRVLATLQGLGLLDRTLVIYSADHGDFCGGHGMMDKHYAMYDDIVRVPLICRFPGVAPSVCHAPVIHALDLATTIVTAAGLQPPPSFCGQDLRGLSRGEITPRDSAFVQYFGTQQGLYSSRALRTDRWKYVYNPAAFDELYDLHADPGELHNRADDPACAAVLEACRERMGRWMSEAGDPLSPPLWTWPH
ncbi:MAG: sulfatase-like hydrolase/transferase [Tepidisphaerales bacterium]